MPSGAKKRKAAKKKKGHDSSATNSHQGENDGGELSSPASQDHHNNQEPSTEVEAFEVEKREDNSFENKSTGIEKDSGVEEGNIEIDVVSKLKKSHGSSSSSSSSSSDDESHVVEKKVVALESAPFESAQAIESLPEKLAHKIEELEISTNLDLVKPVESLPEEVPKVYDETKEEKNDFVREETPLVVEEQTVIVDEIASKDDCSTSSVVVESVSKENGVIKLPSLDEKASSESKAYVASSTSPKGSISEVNGSNEPDTTAHSYRQSLVASTPLAVQKTTSWKSCCGILELFSGSER